MQPTIEERKGFIFYRSFYEAIKVLPREFQGEVLTAILEYSFNGVTTENLKPVAKAMFTLIKPQLDANFTKFENGNKGGAPKGNRNNPSGRVSKELTGNQPETNLELTGNQPETNRTTTENQAKEKEKDKEEIKREVEVENGDQNFNSIAPPTSTQDNSFLPIEQCRDVYDTFHEEKKNVLCVMKGLKMEQLNKLLDEFDEFLKTKTNSKIVHDYISHFPNWLNTTHGISRTEAIRKPKFNETDRLKELFP